MPSHAYMRRMVDPIAIWETKGKGAKRIGCYLEKEFITYIRINP